MVSGETESSCCDMIQFAVRTGTGGTGCEEGGAFARSANRLREARCGTVMSVIPCCCEARYRTVRWIIPCCCEARYRTVMSVIPCCCETIQVALEIIQADAGVVGIWEITGCVGGA